ncbi:uncharacterized protein EV420DRAFT_1524241, partial [Desarmillaria tabescens]
CPQESTTVCSTAPLSGLIKICLSAIALFPVTSCRFDIVREFSVDQVMCADCCVWFSGSAYPFMVRFLLPCDSLMNVVM